MSAEVTATFEQGSGKALVASAALHLAVLALLIFGPPSFFKSRDDELPISVDLVMIDELSDKATAPKPAEPVPQAPAPEKPAAEVPKPEPTPPAKLAEPKPAPPAPPPPPAEAAPPLPPPPAVAETPPAPAPEPEPVKTVAVPEETVAPQPEPEPKPEPKPVEAKTPTPPKPTAKPKEIAQAKPPQPESKTKVPEPKPEEKPDPLASVLKNVQKLANQQPQSRQTAASEAQAQPSPAPAQAESSQVQTAELQRAVRQQMERCWRVDPGAQNAEDVTVRIRVRLGQDGNLTAPVEFLEEGRYRSEMAYRVAAEGARRAVLNCQPFRLPPKHYDSWRELTLNFNPRDMF